MANNGPLMAFTKKSYCVSGKGGKNLAKSIAISGMVDISEHPK
jgi:hypothetical protein